MATFEIADDDETVRIDYLSLAALLDRFERQRQHVTELQVDGTRQRETIIALRTEVESLRKELEAPRARGLTAAQQTIHEQSANADAWLREKARE